MVCKKATTSLSNYKPAKQWARIGREKLQKANLSYWFPKLLGAFHGKSFHIAGIQSDVRLRLIQLKTHLKCETLLGLAMQGKHQKAWKNKRVLEHNYNFNAQILVQFFKWCMLTF